MGVIACMRENAPLPLSAYAQDCKQRAPPTSRQTHNSERPQGSHHLPPDIHDFQSLTDAHCSAMNIVPGGFFNKGNFGENDGICANVNFLSKSSEHTHTFARCDTYVRRRQKDSDAPKTFLLPNKQTTSFVHLWSSSSKFASCSATNG